MSENPNTEQGKISGKQDNISDDSSGRISGIKKSIADSGVSGTLTEKNNESLIGKPHTNSATNLKERITYATLEKGLKTLPINFGDVEGDWKVIESENLFEVLYLDYEQVVLIDTALVTDNFNIIDKFWREKRNLWESGSGQVRKSIEDKYGAGNLAACLRKIGIAQEQLSTLEKIKEYSERLKVKRIQNGQQKLDPLLRMMLKDGIAEPGEIEGIIEEGLKYDLNTEEVALIIKYAIDSKAYRPYGNVIGNLLSEKLLSVSWMTEEKLIEAKTEAEAKKKAGREIFDGIYAYSVEEIGEIIFNREKEAKRDIGDGLLKNSIDYFSTAKARQFIDIINTQKDEHLRYLQIAYRLKPQLPYRFSSSQLAKSPKELCNMMFETLASFNRGKEQFKNGYIEVWLWETNKEAYSKFKIIREKGENLDLTYLEFLYTFNPNLPYRFAGQYLVDRPEELYAAIDKSLGNWDAGRTELFNLFFSVWLKTGKNSQIIEQWEKEKYKFDNKQDLGLEYFLHLLINNIKHPNLTVNKTIISYPKIQSGQIISTDIIFINSTRGYLEASLSLSKQFEGVSISKEAFQINNLSGTNNLSISLSINSNLLLKGIVYETTLMVTTFEQQKIEIPVSFNIVFPKNAFFLQILKYAAGLAFFFGLIRLALSSEYGSWMNETFNAFISWEDTVLHFSAFSLFGWTFFGFGGVLIAGIIFLYKYLKK